MVIDVGGEVAGGGPVPHACIGKARRVPARDRAGQAAAILEGVQNHAPQVRQTRGRCIPTFLHHRSEDCPCNGKARTVTLHMKPWSH